MRRIPDPPKALRTAQVAALLQVSPKTVNRWAKDGRLIPTVKTLGGHRRWEEAKIRALLDELTHTPQERT